MIPFPDVTGFPAFKAIGYDASTFEPYSWVDDVRSDLPYFVYRKCCDYLKVNYADSPYLKKWLYALAGSDFAPGIIGNVDTEDLPVSGYSASACSLVAKVIYEAMEGVFSLAFEEEPDEDDYHRYWNDEVRQNYLVDIDELEAAEREQGVRFPFIPGWDDRPGRVPPLTL